MAIIPFVVNNEKSFSIVDEEKNDYMESNLTGWSDHKFLTGQVMVSSHTQAYYFFSKKFIFVLSNPCPLILCI